MKRSIIILLFAILLTGTAIAQDSEIQNFELIIPAMDMQGFEKVFPVFLSHLVKRHEELKTLAMPAVEVRTAEGFDNEAVYITVFKTLKDAQTFSAALDKEGIPYGTITGKEQQLILFYSDLIVFIMKAAIGL